MKCPKNKKYMLQFHDKLVELDIISYQCKAKYLNLDETIRLGHEMVHDDNPHCLSKHRMGFGYLTDLLISETLPQNMLDIVNNIKLIHLAWIKSCEYGFM